MVSVTTARSEFSKEFRHRMGTSELLGSVTLVTRLSSEDSLKKSRTQHPPREVRYSEVGSDRLSVGEGF